MLGNLQIYRKESEPRDRESFLWIHTDEDGNTVAQIYNGVKWMTIGSTSITDAEVCCEVNSTRIAEHEVAIKGLQESSGEQGGSGGTIIEVNDFNPYNDIQSQSDLDTVGLTVDEIQAAAQGKRTGIHATGTITGTTTTYDKFYRILSAHYSVDGQAYDISIGLHDDTIDGNEYYMVWVITYNQSDFSSKILPVINGGGDEPSPAL